MSIPTTIPSNRTFGIEVEFVGIQPSAAVAALRTAGILINDEVAYNHRNSHTHWKVVTDGSLSDRHGRGCGELVSPILNGVEGLRNVVNTITALNNAGGTVNRSCGLHVHVGADGLSVADMGNIAVRYAVYENVIDSWMPASRRASANQYCGTMRYLIERDRYNSSNPYNYITSMSQARSSTSLAGIFYNRYQKVNFQSLSRQNTIEFRQHGGTCNAEKITNWIVFLLGFVETSRLGNLSASAPDRPVPTSAPALTPVVARAMPAQLRRIADTIEALTNNPTTSWQPGADIAALRTATGLSAATVRAYVSTLRSQYNFGIRQRYGRYRMVRRGSETTTAYAAQQNGRGRRARRSPAITNHMESSAMAQALRATAEISSPSFDHLFAALSLPASVKNFFEERVEEFSSAAR
jgi:hypothetical protein